MKNLEPVEFLEYQEACRFLSFIRSQTHKLALRDYCAVFMMLEYGWKISELLNKKVSDALQLIEEEGAGHKPLKEWCSGRQPGSLLFPGRGGREMTARNIQQRLLMWSYIGGFKPIAPSILINTHRAAKLAAMFTGGSFEWNEEVTS